jgi:hypothetical protein
VFLVLAADHALYAHTKRGKVRIMCGRPAHDNLWTIAYRKSTANFFHRVTDWAGTWQQAFDMAGKFAELNPRYQVFYTSTREADLTDYVCDADKFVILTDSGKRVFVHDDAKLDARLTV